MRAAPTMSARIAVVVPAGDSAPPLEDTLRSVLRQTCGDYEVIVVDGGAAPEVGDVIDRFAGARRLRVVEPVPDAAASARDVGLRCADGDYAAFCMPGHVWRRDALATHVRHLSADSRVGASLARYALRLGRGGPLAPPPNAPPRRLTTAEIGAAPPALCGGAMVARRAALDDMRATRRPAARRRWFEADLGPASAQDVLTRISLLPVWKCEILPVSLATFRASPDDADRSSDAWRVYRRRLFADRPDAAGDAGDPLRLRLAAMTAASLFGAGLEAVRWAGAAATEDLRPVTASLS